MWISRLDITKLRILKSVALKPEKKINVFVGENGSGKTSLLEAVHFLGLGRSFRHRQASRVIQYEADELTVYAELEQAEQLPLKIGLKRTRAGEKQLKVNGDNQATIEPLLDKLPLQLINPDGYKLLDSGPKFRRQFMDWGLFHVEPTFFDAWKKFQRLLQQRNAALKEPQRFGDATTWNIEFVAKAETIHAMRENYLEKLEPVFFETLVELLALDGISFQYAAGWSQQDSLLESLKKHFFRDKQLGFTQNGPQRADLQLKIQSMPVQDVLSRGQQKLVVCALRLAQGVLLRRENNKPCIYLLDDLPAELDSKHRKKVLEILQDIDAQVFVTGVNREDFDDLVDKSHAKVFHVKHGEVSLEA